MLRVQRLQLFQFKNHQTRQLSFGHKVVGICGPNGIGKTNLLDALYFLCFTKSYFVSTDSALPTHGQKGLRAEGQFDLNGQAVKVTGILRETGKKECSWNDEPYTKMSAHVGRLPAVMIAPDDVELITGGSETRRRLVDGLLCQLHPEYMQQLIDYNKLLQQRNSQLKQMVETNRRTDALLDILDEQLASRAVFVARHRQHMLTSFLPQAEKHYRTIAGNEAEAVAFGYQTTVTIGEQEDKNREQYLQMLKQSLPKDLALQRTTAGIHRDDLVFQLNEQPFRALASQGQRKSLLFALKLTEYEWLEQHKGFAPLLLLDDVFEKLDDQRMANLLKEVCVEKQGQVFITDTNHQRLQTALQKIGADFEVIELSE